MAAFPLLALRAAALETRPLARRIKRSAAVFAIVALCAFGATIFALIALYAALTPVLGPVGAALVIAAAFVTVALASWIFLRIAEAREKAKARERAGSRAALISALAVAALPTLVRSRTGLIAAAPLAIVAYLLLSGRSTPASDPEDD